MNAEYLRIWKRTVVVCIKILLSSLSSWVLRMDIQESHKISHSRRLSRVISVTARKQAYRVTAA